MAEKFDIAVIGGGPGGYLAAERGAEKGFKVCLFEKDSIGGVCLNEGCIPSKALLNSARIYHSALKGDKYGVIAPEIRLDHSAVMKRKNKVVKLLTAGVSAKMKKAGVTVIKGCAFIEGKREGGFAISCGEEEYLSDKLIIATGSSPALPPIPGLKEGIDSGFCLTSREVLSLGEVPEKLTVIGAGVIGLEMASYYAIAGAEVTVIEMLDKIAGNADDQISSLLEKELTQKGIKFLKGTRVTEIGEACVSAEKDGEKQVIEADKVLVCIGRRPNIDGFGLENTEVLTEKGRIVTDEEMRTNVDGIYAVGDVNGKSMLAHTAYREAEAAINNISGAEDTVDYGLVPAVIYTSPEVAWVGESIAEARKRGAGSKEIVLPMNMSGRYMAEVERGTGTVKAVVDEPSGIILGIHLFGSYASEMIVTCELMMNEKFTLEELKKIIFPHPTVGEAVRELLFEI